MKTVKYIALILLALAASGAFGKKSQTENPSIVLGYDKLCWHQPTHLIAQVSAIPLVCDAKKKCTSFEKVIPLKAKSSYKVNFSEIRSKSGLDTDNTILVAAICNDANHNGRCDRNEKPVVQALRLDGKYLKTLYPEGILVLDFHPVTNAPDYCKSL